MNRAPVAAKARAAQDVLRPEFGEQVARARRAQGWSQSQLAHEIAKGMGRRYSQTTISQWERGETSMPEEVRDFLEELISPASLRDAASRPTAARAPSDGVEVDLDVRARNYDLWLSCVSLPKHFPILKKARDASWRPFLNTDRERAVAELIDHLAADDGRWILVSFATGHGVTTLSDHVLAEMNANRIRSSVLAASIWAGEAVGLDADGLEEPIRRRLLLALARRAMPMHENPQALEHEQRPWRDLRPWAQGLIASLATGEELDAMSAEAFGDVFAHVSLADTMSRIKENYGLFMSLHIDTSAKDDRSAPGVTELGYLCEQVSTVQKRTANRASTTFTTVAFGEAANLSRASAVAASAAVETLTIRPYNAAEVYRMLLDRYGDRLMGILSPQALEGIAGRHIPLARTEDLLRTRVLERFDTDNVPYRIEIT